MKNILPYLLVASAAVLWGGIGIFIDALDRAGFTSLQIVALRVGSATLMLLIYLLLRDPKLLKIKSGDSVYFIGTGVFSISFFNWCYFSAIQETSLSVAVILLYTGPAFVVIMSRIFFDEPFTKQKTGALILTITGCVLVVELIPFSMKAISWYGILLGLGSGFGYALYSIFGKTVLDRYSSLTILFYTFLAASLVMLPLSGTLKEENLALLTDTRSLAWTVGLGFLPTALAYFLYTEGLSKIEAGKASITAMMEPVAATLIGVTVFEEILSVVQLFGMTLVLLSVLLIQSRMPIGRLWWFRK